MRQATLPHPEAIRPPSPLDHGGNLAAARRRFPAAALPWIDLSTGINPVPYPTGTIPPEAWTRLPDADALAAVEQAAARTYGASRSDAVVAAPGTQAIIQLLPRLLPARRVAVLGFGYEEHPAAWAAAGADVTVVDRLDDLRGADVAVVVNPNNPDGRRIDAADLRDLAGALGQAGTLVVDEAFADVAGPACSLVPHRPAGTIVLRSFGKMFGLAGLRLGFAIADASLAAALRAALGPWPVSGPALAVAARALPDAAWQAATLARLDRDAGRLDALLGEAGLTVAGGTPLFRLVVTPDATHRFDALGRAGILVRPFAQRPTWLRFGLPADEAAWRRLAVALRQ